MKKVFSSLALLFMSVLSFAQTGGLFCQTRVIPFTGVYQEDYFVSRKPGGPLFPGSVQVKFTKYQMNGGSVYSTSTGWVPYTGGSQYVGTISEYAWCVIEIRIVHIMTGALLHEETVTDGC